MAREVTCPACHASRVEIIKPWRLGRGHYAVACCDCGLLFVNPLPAQEVLDAYYAPDGGWQASRDSSSPHPPQTRTKKGGAPALFAALDQFFPASTPTAGARVFDFGCGPGTWLNSFQDHGWDTYGLEPASDVAFVRHKRLLTIPSQPQFDLVIVYHVLEHLPRPLETLRELAQAIVPGGYCMVGVPRLDTLAIHGDIKYCLHRRNHIMAFTEACLRGLLARANLETVAAFHHLDEKFSKGVPIRMRLLARKTTATPPLEPDPATALKPVIEAFLTLRKPPSDAGVQATDQ
jgi:SAM-dependent methyltransferase